MEDPILALNAVDTFNDAGNFYKESFKGKNIDNAIALVATGLQTSLKTNIDNVAHNLSNDDKHYYLASNVDLSTNANSTIIPEGIHSSCLLQDSAKRSDNIAINGIHYWELKKENEKAYSIYNNSGAIGSGYATIQGFYNKYSDIANSLMSSYMGVDKIPLGKCMELLGKYLSGEDQSIATFMQIINGLCGAKFVDGNYTLAEVDGDSINFSPIQYYTAMTLAPIDLNNPPICLVFDDSIKSYVTLNEAINDTFFPIFAEATVSGNTLNIKLRDIVVGNKTRDEIIELIKWLAPLGYNINIQDWTI